MSTEAKTKSDEYPMPPGWKRAISKAHNNKPYFINAETKETTWIDPRDKLWKKQRWEDCGPDELPYGWEIAHDPIVGQYFIDHVSRRNLLDDPRSTKPQEQMREVKSFVDQAAADISKTEDILKSKAMELAKVQNQAEIEEKRLQEQLNAGRKTEAERQIILEKIDEKRAQVQSLQTEVKQIETHVETTKKQVHEVTAVIETLEADKVDQLDRQKQIQQEIAQLKQELSHQSQIRRKLAIEIVEMEHSYKQSTAVAGHASIQQEQATMNEILQHAENAVLLPTEIPLQTADCVVALEQPVQYSKLSQQQALNSAVQTVSKEMVRQTRIEREMELLMLRKQVQEEKSDVTQLRHIAEVAKAEVERAMQIPEQNTVTGKKMIPKWVRLLNEYSKKSGAIRENVLQKQSEAVSKGEVMSFRDKLIFFTSNPFARSSNSTTKATGSKNKL